LIDVSFIEQGVFKYPPGLDGWRFYRIEYRKIGEHYPFLEYMIWLPPDLDVTDIEDLINDCDM